MPVCCQILLCHKEKLHKEDKGKDIGQHGNILCLSGEQLDDSVNNQSDTDGMSDGTGDRHGDQHECNRCGLGNVTEIDILQTGKHQDTNIDQCG